MMSFVVARCMQRLVLAGAIAGFGCLAIAGLAGSNKADIGARCYEPAFGPTCQYALQSRAYDTGFPGLQPMPRAVPRPF